MMTPQSSSVLGEEATQVLGFTSLLGSPEGKEESNASIHSDNNIATFVFVPDWFWHFELTEYGLGNLISLSHYVCIQSSSSS